VAPLQLPAIRTSTFHPFSVIEHPFEYAPCTTCPDGATPGTLLQTVSTNGVPSASLPSPMNRRFLCRRDQADVVHPCLTGDLVVELSARHAGNDDHD